MSDERELLDRCRSDNPQALREVVERHQSDAYALALRMLRDSDDAADATQDAFLNLFRSLGTFRGECSLRTWIWRLVTNECLRRLKRLGRERDRFEVLPEPDDAAVLADAEAAPPDDRVARRERTRLLLDAVGRLRPDFRAVVVLHYMQELSYEEVAGVLEIPMGTVKTWLFRAKKALAEELVSIGAEEWADELS